MLFPLTNTDLLSQFAFKTFLFIYSSQKESLWVWFCLSLLLCLFHLRHSVFLQFRKVCTHTPSHNASFPFALAAPSGILDAAKPSQSILQVFQDALISSFFVSLYSASWGSSSDLFSKALMLSSSLYNMLV